MFKSISLTIVILFIPISIALANDSTSNDGFGFLGSVIIAVLSALLGTILGYWFAILRGFREFKQKAYQEILHPIMRMGYEYEGSDDYNQALAKLWLYANKDVARKMDTVASIVADPKRGNLTTALQEAVTAMRKDIQLFPWQKLDPKEVNHLYISIMKRRGLH